MCTRGVPSGRVTTPVTVLASRLDSSPRARPSPTLPAGDPRPRETLRFPSRRSHLCLALHCYVHRCTAAAPTAAGPPLPPSPPLFPLAVVATDAAATAGATTPAAAAAAAATALANAADSPGRWPPAALRRACVFPTPAQRSRAGRWGRSRARRRGWVMGALVAARVSPLSHTPPSFPFVPQATCARRCASCTRPAAPPVRVVTALPLPPPPFHPRPQWTAATRQQRPRRRQRLASTA